MSSDPDPATPAGGSPRGPLTAEDLITLNEEIAGMARAGLPLDQGLTVLAREMRWGRLQAVTRQLGDDLRAGLTLPQALDKQAGRVPPYYAALLNAAIRSGKTGEVLGTLTLYARSIADFRANVTGALLYPAMVLIIGVGLLAFVGVMVLPNYVEIFETFKMKLPLMTRVLFFCGEHVLEFLAVPVVAIVAILVAERFWLRTTPSGRILWARMVNALPLIGALIRSARLAAFTDLLGILVDQSVPLAEALRLAAEASSDPLLAEAAKHIEKDLNQGMGLGEALQRHGLVPELVVWMVRFGERQGTLGAALHQLAQMYRRQADVRAALLRSVLPPLLILLLAMTLGSLFIFGLIQPLLSLMEGLSGGAKK